MRKIVDSPLTLIVRRWQRACHLPFSLSCRAIHSLCQNVTMPPIDCQMCMTRNRWHSVDTHINHIETAFVHSIIVCHHSHTHYWHPMLRSYVLSFTSRGCHSTQFQVNCYPHYSSETWHGLITFLRSQPAICGMLIISLVLGKYSSTMSLFLIQLRLLGFHDVP